MLARLNKTVKNPPLFKVVLFDWAFLGGILVPDSAFINFTRPIKLEMAVTGKKISCSTLMYVFYPLLNQSLIYVFNNRKASIHF